MESLGREDQQMAPSSNPANPAPPGGIHHLNLETCAQMSSAEVNLVSTGGEAMNEARLVWPSPARQVR